MTEETKNAPQPAQATAPAGGQAPAADLTVQDLGVIRSIIDVASTRGAFKANESFARVAHNMITTAITFFTQFATIRDCGRGGRNSNNIL